MKVKFSVLGMKLIAFDLNFFMIFENSIFGIKMKLSKLRRKKWVTKSLFVFCFHFTKQNQGFFVNILLFGIYCFDLFMAVPRNLFFGLHVPDPISGLHINTFERNILCKYPSICLTDKN